MNLPNKIFGIETKGAYERALASFKNKKPEVKPGIILPQSDIENLQDWIVLPGHKHEAYEYPDLLVSMHRLSYTPEVERVVKGLGYNLKNTAKEEDGHEYIGGITWEQALKLNLGLGDFTLNPRQLVDFLNLLRSGRAFDGTGNIIDRRILESILDEMIAVRNPWRSEWLDAGFKVKKVGENNVLYLHSAHILYSNGNLTPQYKKQLKDCLMEDRTPGIDFDYWLNNATSQGLPPKDIPNGSFYYRYPIRDNISVALLSAGSDWAYLGCIGGPSDLDDGLGVRRAKIKA